MLFRVDNHDITRNISHTAKHIQTYDEKSGHKYYDRIDYEIKKGLSKEFVNELPKAMIKL